MKGKVFGSIYTYFCFINSGTSKRFKKQKSDTNIYNKHFKIQVIGYTLEND